MRRRLLLAGLAAGLAPRPAASADAEALWERLRGGGLVLLLRHARTVPGTGDPPDFRLEDCATQRNLSEAGRAEARAIGAELRRRGLPVDRVLTSAWCRCRETAELLGLGPVERLPALDSFFAEPGAAALRTGALLGFVRGWRGPGHALAVTHQVNVTAATGLHPAQGEIVAVEPATARAVLRLVPTGAAAAPLEPRTV